MSSYGDDWDRFSSRHLGDWQGRSLAISVADGSLVSATSYRLSSQSVTLSKTNESSLLLTWTLENESEDAALSTNMLLRYNLEKFHCFPDGSYSADHTLLEMAHLLPNAHRVAHHAIEFALPVSATERIRCFMLYNKARNLENVLLLEEVRSGLFDTREPLALTSLVGEWKGQCETFRHEVENDRPIGFHSKPAGKSPTRRARRVYSEDDLPSQLKNPSGGEDGLLKTKTSVHFGWDPAKGVVRRATMLTDMQGNELGRSVVYGSVSAENGGLFDIARFESNTANESVFVALNNACFAMAPMKRVRGVPAAGELGCLITPGFRRRLVRIYGKNTVASETLSSESLK